MKNTQTFSNKMVDLTGMQDYERITAEFNRLTKDYYAKEKNPVQRFRTLRQIRIRLASAKKVYEVAGKESEYIIRCFDVRIPGERFGSFADRKQSFTSELVGQTDRFGRDRLRSLCRPVYQRRTMRHSGDCSRFRAIVRCQIAAYLQPTVGYPKP